MKKQILIVDDEQLIRSVYKRILEATGSSIFDVREAADANQAMEYIIRYPIDVVILDINMPEVDGKCTYDIIKEYNPNQKIIVASVYSIHHQRHIIPFAEDYFDKSQGPMKFLEKISLHCL